MKLSGKFLALSFAVLIFGSFFANGNCVEAVKTRSMSKKIDKNEFEKISGKIDKKRRRIRGSKKLEKQKANLNSGNQANYIKADNIYSSNEQENKNNDGMVGLEDELQIVKKIDIDNHTKKLYNSFLDIQEEKKKDKKQANYIKADNIYSSNEQENKNNDGMVGLEDESQGMDLEKRYDYTTEKVRETGSKNKEDAPVKEEKGEKICFGNLKESDIPNVYWSSESDEDKKFLLDAIEFNIDGFMSERKNNPMYSRSDVIILARNIPSCYEMENKINEKVLGDSFYDGKYDLIFSPTFIRKQIKSKSDVFFKDLVLGKLSYEIVDKKGNTFSCSDERNVFLYRDWDMAWVSFYYTGIPEYLDKCLKEVDNKVKKVKVDKGFKLEVDEKYCVRFYKLNESGEREELFKTNALVVEGDIYTFAGEYGKYISHPNSFDEEFYKEVLKYDGFSYDFRNHVVV